MKTIVLTLAVIITAVFFLTGTSSAQCDDKNKSEAGEHHSKECCTKTGNSSGTLADTSLLCPVSGEPVGHEGTGVKFTYLGKEYTFCCEGCAGKFKTEPLNYIKEEIKCPVMGKTATKEVFTVVDGVKYYFCCESCISKFEDNPSKYLLKEN